MKKTQTQVVFQGLRPTTENGRKALRNPERGLRHEMIIARTADDQTPWARTWYFDRFPEDEVVIAQAYCYLTQYHDSPIADSKLQALEAEFAEARRHGIKFLLRFAYENDSNRVCPTVEGICRHMDQLKPVLDRNWDVIYVIQCGWVGLWGEFHTSIRNIDNDPRQCARIIAKMLEILPPDRFTMMRYPKRKRQVLQELGALEPITPGTAFTQRPNARIGFFNDGTLADPGDGGTFNDHPLKGAPGNPDFDFITHDAPYMPVEGELFWNGTTDSRYASAARAIERFRLHHYSTFSYRHGQSGLDGHPSREDKTDMRGSIDFWKETPVTAEWLAAGKYPFSPAYFDGAERTAFEYIRDHLGYRLEAQDAVFDGELAAGDTFTATLRIVNRGFATMINPREFSFVLLHKDGSCIEIPTGFNGQGLQPYQPGDPDCRPLTHTICASFRIPETAAPGEWALYLWAPDMRPSLRYRPDYAVRLANEIPWEERVGRGMNRLGTVRILKPQKPPLQMRLSEDCVTLRYRGIRPTDPDGRNALMNPERGLRFEIGTGRLESDEVKHGVDSSHWPFKAWLADGVSIGQGYCYLTQFHDSPISQEKLDAIQRDFDILRGLGIGAKFLLRFAYEFDGVTHGPTAERICAHMKQLKPVLDRNWDVIYVLQTGWVGLWGEFHTAIHETEKDIAKTAMIVRSTLDLLPPDRFTMMRRMGYKKKNLEFLGCMEEVTAETALSQRPAARIGFFNDGTLANESDGCTFPDPPLYAAPGNWEFDYLNREAPFLPVDGELFWSGQVPMSDPDNPAPYHGLDLTYSSAAKAIERFRLQHYSTFSYVHGFSGLEKPIYGVIDAWKDTPITARELEAGRYPFSPDYFDGASRTAFEYIRDHLGYRLEALRSSFNNVVRPGGKLHIELELINRGFAAPVNPREICFVLGHASGENFEIPTGVNAQTLQPYRPGDPGFRPLTHRISVDAAIPADMQKGEWTLTLWMPDGRESLRLRPDYAVRLANNVEWYDMGGRGVSRLGSVLVAG